MDTFFKTITWLGSLYLLAPFVLLLSLFLFSWQKRTESLFLLLALVTTSLVTHLLKILVARPRPAAEDLLVNMPADFSFPSAHTSQITACALVLCILATREFAQPAAVTAAWGILTLLVIAVGYSRVYLQVHYISDVLVGGGLAALLVLLTARFLGITVKS
jgi:undecaprenyl-diphosphatase